MTKPIPYTRGEKVLASRAQAGGDHEEATVVDHYNLLIGGDDTPIVVVLFEDGERLPLKVESEDVMPMPEPEEGAENGDSDEEGDS